MDYLKIVDDGIIKVSSAETFDSHGLKARFKIKSGTVYIGKPFGGLNYTLKEGDVLEFAGKVEYSGNSAFIEYLLFDRV